METILSNTMRRRFYLLYALHSATGWSTIEDLMAATNVSRKTVIADLHYLEDHWSEYITMDYQKKLGYRLIQSKDHSIHDIYRYILKDSSAFKLLEAIFFNPNRTAEYWKKTFHLSSASLYRLAQKIQKVLNLRGMDLNKTPYRIEGKNERQIQIFFKRFFWEAYGIHEWPFKLDQKAVYNFVEQMNQDFHWEHGDVDRVDLAYAIAVTIVRSEQNYLMVKVPRMTARHRKLIALMEKYKPDMEKIIAPLGYQLPEKWKEDFIITVFWWEFAWDNVEESLRLRKIGYDFVDQVITSFDFTIDNESRERINAAFIKTYMRHKIYPYPRYIFYNRSWYSSHILTQDHLFFGKVMEKILKDLEAKTDCPWYSMYFDHMITVVAFYWKDFFLQFDNLRKVVEVAVFSDLGRYHAESLANYLKAVFGKKIETKVQPDSFYYLKDPQTIEVDIYVANFTLKKIPNDKLFVVEDIPSYKNLVDLQQGIDKLRVPRLKETTFFSPSI
ncbi:helix-turn-helix domain-containing protein [Enterococcus sp. AZ103]|uniref:helix-turn-helix domain-containing protein n=1 Tax=Enterococcus sp. AZ103 TaxID=2774628 RepID=UPI003F26502D